MAQDPWRRFSRLAGDQHIDFGTDLKRGSERLRGCRKGWWLSCPAVRRMAICLFLPNAGFVLELVKTFRHRLDLDAGLATAKLLDLDDLGAESIGTYILDNYAAHKHPKVIARLSRPSLRHPPLHAD